MTRWGWSARIYGLVIAAALTGCVTAYQPYSLTGGYKDRQVGPNRHYVEFYGNGKTTRDTVFAYWLYRCAELTRDKGFDYFALISRTPPQGAAAHPQGESTALARGGAPVYTFVPGGTIRTWSARGVIELRKGQPGDLDEGPAFAAKEVLSLLGPSVRQAMASGGNVTLPQRYAQVDEERAAPPERGRGAVRLEDLEGLLPK